MNIWKSYVNCGVKNYLKEDHRSYIHNLCSWEKKAWKKFRLVWNSNPWPLRYRCSALPIKLTDECTMVNPFIAGSLVLFTFRPYLWKGVQESFQVKWLLKFLSMSWKILFLKSHSKNLEASSFNEIKWIGFYRLIIKAAFLHGPECWLFQ